MARTLIIKNADFSINRLTTVEFSDVPCTGITFESNTIEVTNQTPVTINYTLTPSDTTDIVVWTSSDTTVVSMTGNVMTIVGLGSATITATCGSYSATATITVDISYISNWEWALCSGGNNTGTYAAYNDSDSNYCKGLSSFGIGAQKSAYALAPSREVLLDNAYAIILPKNTAKIKIKYNNVSILSSSWPLKVIWMKNELSGQSGSLGNYIKHITTVEPSNTSNIPEYFEVPEGSDCVIVSLRLAVQYTSYANNPSGFATENGLDVEFLTAA